MRPRRCPYCKRQPEWYEDKLPHWPHVLWSLQCSQGTHFISSSPFSSKEDTIYDWNREVVEILKLRGEVIECEESQLLV